MARRAARNTVTVGRKCRPPHIHREQSFAAGEGNEGAAVLFYTIVLFLVQVRPVRPSPSRSLQRHAADATTYFTSDSSKASTIAVAP